MYQINLPGFLSEGYGGSGYMFHGCLLSPPPSDGTLKNTMGAQSTAGLSKHFLKLKDLVQENYFKC
jgi:hypothetical protein